MKLIRRAQREVKDHLKLGILIMHSMFLGFMNSYDLNVDHSIVIAEGVAVTCSVLARWRSSDDDPDMSLLTIYEAINIGCYILIATVYKGATRECKGYSDTLFGDIVPEYGLLSVRDSCGMQRATFALSIVVV